MLILCVTLDKFLPYPCTQSQQDQPREEHFEYLIHVPALLNLSDKHTGMICVAAVVRPGLGKVNFCFLDFGSQLLLWVCLVQQSDI